MTNDWRYSKERMDLRAKSLEILGKAFTLKREVYEFCDIWISQGGKDASNIVNEFIRYIEDVEVLRQNEAKARKSSSKKTNKNSGEIS
jgi:hypothetical protein|tara:strand:+ start:6043 stop:6306 length:264 start_codon:yes stop_codon:yes gene_type:complete